MRTKTFPYYMLVLFVIAATLLSACGSAAAPAASSGGGVSSVPADLVAACKTEGMVNIIATPGNWANYQENFDLFTATTRVKINSLDENARSADELKAIEANQSSKRPPAADILEVS